jgi:hypothetical protein
MLTIPTNQTIPTPQTLQTTTTIQTPSCQRQFRLVDNQGAPHPVLDDLYESLDAAWSEAMEWWQSNCGSHCGPVEIGVEVSTTSGNWRTLRYPGS